MLTRAEVEQMAEHAHAGHEKKAHVLPTADAEDFANDEGRAEERFVKLLGEA